ncbi:hypothetical protein [Streptomyces himalayensis]|uniref:Uncharacterized protein n=1 Tax=Streptomyces himalayensis subsp. himalayensis TaxID=2756131 RepID=A0A7W0DST6_9ACTN|nr:hypothetical protein [Streptomyces himalayensis]MBA2950639.1 hypothetical protein [Streptomyces himalayensis subsp. himalayensis]
MRIVRALAAAAAGMTVAAATTTVAAAPAAAAAPEADVAYHGYVAMVHGQVGLWLTPQNHGPTNVPDATVRLRWSSPLADLQQLPGQCARAGVSTVLCRTGALEAGGLGRRIVIAVRLAGAPSEVTLQIDTVWSGGARDRNPQNDRHRVLALDTGDSYYF